MADKRKILELDIDVESILSKSVELKTMLDKLRENLKTVGAESGKNSEEYVKLSAQISKVSGEYNLNQRQLSNLAQVNGDYLTVQQKLGLVLDKEALSVSEASKQNAALLKIRNDLKPSIEGEKKLIDEINAKIDTNTEFIKSNASETEKQRMSIGGYKDAIIAATQSNDTFSGKLNQLKVINESVRASFADLKEQYSTNIQAIKDYSKGTEGMTAAQKTQAVVTSVASGSLNLFKVALASTGIGLLVLALAGLIGYFTQTQAGIDKLNSILYPLKAIFQSISSAVINLGGKLVETFSNPKKALEDLGSFLVTNLINRFTALGKILDGIIHLDFKKVGDGILQAGTGIENLTGKIANVGKETAKAISDAAKAGKDIADRQKEINEKQLQYNKNQVAIGDEIDKQLLISKDTSKSFAERAEAANKIIAINEANGQKEKEILELKLKQVQAENLLKGAKNLTLEDKQREIDLIEEIDAADDRGKDARLEQSRVISGAKKEAHDKAVANAQKAHDQAIAQSKAELDLFIQQQGFKAKSLQEDLDFENKVKDKKLANLKQEFDAKKISQTEYEAQSLAIKNDFLKKQAETTIAFAEIELNKFLDDNKTKIDQNKFLNDELYNQEKQRLDDVLKAKQDFSDKEKEQGLINDEQLRQAKKQAQDEFDAQNLELETVKKEADKEQKAIDAENERAANELQNQNQVAIKQQQLDNAKAQEIEASEKTGASVKLINAKYAGLQKQLDIEVMNSKLQALSQTFAAAKSLFSENTVAYKALAIAQIAMDTIISAQSAYKAMIGIPVIGPTLAPIAAGLAYASGAMNSAKIAGVKLAQGAVDIDGPGTETSDSIPAMLSKGESVINAKATANFKPLLQAINAGVGLDYLGSPNLNFYTKSNQNQSSQIDYDLLAYKISEANKSLPVPKVYTAIEDFKISERNYTQIHDGANH
jgi:hypothetical protein